MTRVWIDFKKVKEGASFEAVLTRYGIELQPRGKELVGKCPFHEEEKASFGVNLEKGVFHCFGCSAKGNVLDFVARKEGVTIRKAAETLAEWQGIDARREKPERTPRNAAGEPKPAGEKVSSSPKEKERAATPVAAQPATPEGEGNRPLTFTLKLDPEHPYLRERGVDRGLAEAFGIGFCSRGMMRGRIAIPLANEMGELVGYVGRWAGPDPPEGEERYKLPPGFKKNEVLFNLHRVRDSEHLVLVEGCWSVFRLHALGVPTVALLGRSLSPKQEELLAGGKASRLTLLMDGDEPGRSAAAELLPRLARRFFVRVVELPEGAEPDMIAEGELRSLLGLPVPSECS